MNNWVELDLGILGSNIEALRQALGTGPDVVFVVKSNAYGHGIHEVAVYACRNGIKWFAVADIDEALELRRIIMDANIIVLGRTDAESVPAMVNNNITPVLITEEQAASLSEALQVSGKSLECHVKVDTGMGRLGLDWKNATGIISRIFRYPGLKITGICTHFASADLSGSDFSGEQMRRFKSVLGQCKERGIQIPFCHISNSGAIMRDPCFDMDAVRPGLLLYGYGGKKGARVAGIKPFLQWKARIIQIKKVPPGFSVSYNNTWTSSCETHIATVAVGYADGYPRLLSNRGQMLAGGRRVQVAGLVTMNLTCIDLGPEPNVSVGDEVVLIGEQGEESLWADEIGGWCSTILYEILTGIGTKHRLVKGPAKQ